MFRSRKCKQVLRFFVQKIQDGISISTEKGISGSRHNRIEPEIRSSCSGQIQVELF